MKHTFATIQKYYKPSNIKEYDITRLITGPLFTIFDFFNFETKFNSLPSLHIKGR